MNLVSHCWFDVMSYMSKDTESHYGLEDGCANGVGIQNKICRQTRLAMQISDWSKVYWAALNIGCNIMKHLIFLNN